MILFNPGHPFLPLYVKTSWHVMAGWVKRVRVRDGRDAHAVVFRENTSHSGDIVVQVPPPGQLSQPPFQLPQLP